MNQNISKNFFLISFLPAILYWYLEANYPVKVAVIGGCSLALLEIIVEKIWINHIHSLSKMNFFLMLFLGGLSIFGDNGLWFKLQPMFTGACIGSYILISSARGKSILYEMMNSLGDQKNMVPNFIFNMLERHLALFFIIYGIFMGGVAFLWSTDYWLFFKTAGFYIISVLFFIFEIIIIRKKMKALFMEQRERKGELSGI